MSPHDPFNHSPRGAAVLPGCAEDQFCQYLQSRHYLFNSKDIHRWLPRHGMCKALGKEGTVRFHLCSQGGRSMNRGRTMRRSCTVNINSFVGCCGIKHSVARGRIENLEAVTPETLKGDSVCCAGGGREAIQGRGSTGAGEKVGERVCHQDPANTQVAGVQSAGGLWLEETGQAACGQVMKHTNAWPSAQQHPPLPLPFC